MVLLNVSRLVLLGLTLLGGYSLHVFSESNGLFPTAIEYQKRGLLYDSTAYSPFFTNNKRVDDVLNILLQFFWPVVDGRHLDVSLAGFLLAAQGGAGYTLLVVEGMRHAQSYHILSFTTVFGILIQLFGYGLVGPFYLLLQLLIGFDTPVRIAQKAAAVSVEQIKVLPYATFIGIIVPTILMGLPSPNILTTSQKIAAILIWQPFPLWTMIIQRMIAAITPRSTSSGKPTSVSGQKLAALRSVYRAMLWSSTVPYLLVVGLSLTAKFRPDLLGAANAAKLTPAHIFVPTNPFAGHKISSISQGALWFLQWDYTITSAAYLVWAVCSRYAISTKKSTSVVDIVRDLVVRPILLGPMSTALVLIWERDEIVLTQGNLISERKKQ